MMSKFTEALVCYIALLLLAGCQPPSLRSDINEYAKRIATIVDTDVPKLKLKPKLKYPNRAKLEAPIEQLNLNLSEFYQLQQCPAKSLIAQRNTALGKIQLPSQRYLYEVKLLEAMRGCLSAKGSPIQALFEAKQAQLPLVWQNLVQMSEEIKLAMSAARRLEPNALVERSRQSSQAFQFLLNLNDLPQTEGNELEDQLKTLATNQLPAQIWYAQENLIIGLNTLTPWLKQQLLHANCAMESDYLANVLQLFFIEKIQATANLVNQGQYALAGIWQAMISHSQLSQPLKDFINWHGIQRHQQLKTALQQHTHVWNAFFERCRKSPL